MKDSSDGMLGAAYQLGDLLTPIQTADARAKQEAAMVARRNAQASDWELMVKGGEDGFRQVAGNRGFLSHYESANPLIGGDQLRKKLVRDLFVQDITGADGDSMATDVPRLQVAKSLFKLDDASPEAFDSALDGFITKQITFRENRQKLYELSQKAALNGNPWADTVEEATRLVGGDLSEYQDAFNKGRSDLFQLLRPQDVQVVNQLWGAAAGLEGEETKNTAGGNLDVSLLEYERMTPEQRKGVMTGIALRAEAEGQDVDGALNRIGAALRSGATDIVSGLVSSDERNESNVLDDVLRQGRVLASIAPITRANYSEISNSLGRLTDDDMASTTRTRALTDEEKKFIKDQADIGRGYGRFLQDLRAAGINAKEYRQKATQGGWFFGDSLTNTIVNLAESVPSMAVTAIPVAGPVMMATSYKEQEQSRLEALFPKADTNTLELQALAVGGWMAGADIIQNKLFASKIPKLNAALMQLGKPGGVALFAGRAATTGVLETGQEIAQDAGQPIVQAIASALDQDIKGPNWDEWMQQQWEALPDTFRVSMLMGIIGGAGSTITDYMDGSRLKEALKDRELLALDGHSPEVVAEISTLAETNPAAAAQLLQSYQATTPAEERTANAQNALRAQELETANVTLREAGLPELVKRDDGKVIVQYNDGVTNDRIFDTVEQAKADMDGVITGQQVEMAHVNRELLAELEGSYNRNIGPVTIDQQPLKARTLQEAVESGETTIEIGRQRARIFLRNAKDQMGVKDIASDEQVDSILGRLFITGKSGISYSEGVANMVLRISENAKPTVVFEEAIEAVGSWMMDRGDVAPMTMYGWIRDAEAKIGTQLLDDDFSGLSGELMRQELLEAWSKIGVAHATGRIQDSQLPNAIKDFFRMIRQMISDVLQLASKVREYTDSKDIDPQFRYWLDVAAGLDPDGMLETQRAEAEAEILNEIDPTRDTFSVAPADPIAAALDKIRGNPEQFVKFANAAKVSVSDVRQRFDRKQITGLDPRSHEASLDGIEQARAEESARYSQALETLRGEENAAIQNEGEAIMAKFGPENPGRNRNVMAEARKKVVEQYKRKRDSEKVLHRDNLRELDRQEERLAQQGRRYDARQSEFDQYRDIAKLEAIARALPGELRGILTSDFRRVAEMRTTKGREAYIASLLPKVEQAIENNLQKTLRKEIKKQLKKGAVKVSDARTRGGKIGGVAHAIFEEVQRTIKLSDNAQQSALQQADEAAEKLRDQLEGDLTDEQLEELDGRIAAIELFGDYVNADSARLTEGLDLLKGVYATGRADRLAVLKARKDQRQQRVQAVLKGLDREGPISDAQRNSAKQKFGRFWSRFNESVLQSGVSGSQKIRRLSENTDDPGIKAVAEDMEFAAVEAELAEQDANEADNIALSQAMRRIFKAKTEYGVSAKLRELTTPGVAKVEKAEGKRSDGVIKVPIRFAESIANGETTGYETRSGERVELTESQIRELQDQLAEMDPEDQQGLRSIEVTVPGDPGTRQGIGEINQLEGLQLWLTMRQPDQFAKLDALGYDQQTMDQLEAWLKPETKALGLWMVDRIGNDAFTVDQLHRSEKGVGLRLVENYFPVRNDISGSDNSGLSIDGSQQHTGKSISSLKERVKNNAPPAYVNAVAVFLANRAQVNFWKSHVSFLREWGGVIRDERFAAAVKNRMGETYYKSLQTTFRRIEGGGALNAASLMDWQKIVRKMTSNFALATLGGRLSTLAINTTAALNPLLEIPGNQLLAGLGDLINRPESLRDAFNSPALQRRWKTAGSYEAQLARAQGLSTHPILAQLGATAQIPVSWITKVDTGSQVIGAAIAWEYTRKQGVASGLTEDLARAEADKKVERIFLRAAQPTTRLAKSELELNAAENPLAALFTLFTSEPRKNLAIGYLAARELLTGKGNYGRAMAAQQLFTVMLVQTTAAYLIRSLYASLVTAKDEEDEEFTDRFAKRLDPKAFAYSLATEHLKSIPIAGEIYNKALAGMLDQPSFDSSPNPLNRVTQKGWSFSEKLFNEKKREELTNEQTIDGGIDIVQSLGTILPGGQIFAQGGNIAEAVEGILSSNFQETLSDEDRVRRIKARFSKLESEYTKEKGPLKGGDGKIDKEKQSARNSVLADALKLELLPLSDELRQKALKEVGASKAVIEKAGFTAPE